MTFAEAIESSIRQAMTADDDVFIIGEDVHTLRRNLYTQFGNKRVKTTPISEAGFVSASVGAAMAGLRPIAEIMLVDFSGVAMDAILNHAAKTYFFSGDNWNIPIVIRAACGGGYGDGGQHEQSLWGWFAHIPGLVVVVPSNPEDAGALMLSAIEYDHPVIYLEHKMLADYWLDAMGIGGRETISFEIPMLGARDQVPDKWETVELGTARTLRGGTDVTIISLGLSVHYCSDVALELEEQNISAEVIDLRFVTPLDIDTIIDSVNKTGKVVIVDEDYTYFGLTGEIAAVLAEHDVNYRFRRVGTEQTIPFNHQRELRVLPNRERIRDAVLELCDSKS